MKHIFGVVVLLSCGGSVSEEYPPSGSVVFDRWREGFSAEVIAEGHSRGVVHSVLGDLRPDERVVTSQSNQAEFIKPIWSYIESAVSEARIRAGREHLGGLGELVDSGVIAGIEREYGVSAFILVAIWGMETRYGEYMGVFDAPRNLATLAALVERRRGFAEAQLRAIFSLLERGIVSREDLRRSSWAGALGHTQFIPATYVEYGVDGDLDGRVDLWGSVSDALASAANYLERRGWKAGLPWLGEARLPAGFDYGLYDGEKRTAGQWRELGVVPVHEGGFGNLHHARARLSLPAGAEGPAFLAFDNFYVIKRYNNSDAYAFSVGLLADALAGRPSLVRGWPRHLTPLTRSQIREVQDILTHLGYPTGGIDGLFGPRTRSATQSFQLSRGLRPDGFLTEGLLGMMRDQVAR